ncbi:hypothetical protein SAMN04488511_102319 [Pedobacter suwonensis]|uniref:Potassium transporter KefB n=1 Tax=Pedobacter suwonensis TaxID=332999 RepID=A0A1I0SPJ2_9SPHI|nr:potassium transporter KefB [Pedobacter suwonensis]SFA41428.1 hypothetical protein SAMN04488511_102319 [Pedobacter suwonensis]
MMTVQENLSEKKWFTHLLFKRMLLVGAIGLVMVGVFVIGAGKGDPAWGITWRIKPLLLTPLLGAFIGLLYDLTEPLRRIKGWIGTVFFVLSIFAVMVGLWMGLILGLNGTMWD